MSSLPYLLLFGQFVSITLVFGTPLPIISSRKSATYDLQSLVKPTEINAMAEIQPNEAEVDILKTIDQVHKMLESNPNLPRLTKGEIEDLFEQVTKEEYQNSLRKGDIERAKYMRSLMLVLPYNTNNASNADLQEIYNRPPITKVVSSEPKPLRPQKITAQSGKVEIISIQNQNPTTYKPAFIKKKPILINYPTPTTYRPSSSYTKSTTEQWFVPTIPTTSPIPIIEQTKAVTGIYSSHYNAKQNEFNSKQDRFQLLFDKIDFGANIPLTTTTSKPKITPELEEILESLGFTSKSQSRKRFKLDDLPPASLSTEELSKPITISSIIKQKPLFNDEQFKPLPINIKGDNFRKGLIPNVKPNDYVAFKPIPIPDDDHQSKGITPDLEDYLNKFGLVELTRGRSQKALKNNENINKIEISTQNSVPKSLSGILDKMEIPKKISRSDDRNDLSYQNTSTVKQDQTADEEDFKKLQELFNTIRELQELNVSLTEDHLKKLNLNNFNLSESLLSQGPDPLNNFDLDLNNKNDIKRQTENPEPIRFNLSLDDGNDTLIVDDFSLNKDVNNSIITTISEDVTSTTQTPTTTKTTTSVPQTTDQSRNGALSDLEDSFGGLDPITEEPLPPPRKNGFYFLSDWNSFLEVGEDPDKIVVRFDPKVGDPSRFIPVNVP